eukprot:1488302-Pleurochrysis_carterae.AAC.1
MPVPGLEARLVKKAAINLKTGFWHIMGNEDHKDDQHANIKENNQKECIDSNDDFDPPSAGNPFAQGEGHAVQDKDLDSTLNRVLTAEFNGCRMDEDKKVGTQEVLVEKCRAGVENDSSDEEDAMAKKRKAVVEDDSSADEDEATTAKCMSKKQAKDSNAETLLASKLNKSETQIAYGGGLTTTKASKVKSVTKFRPEVGSA